MSEPDATDGGRDRVRIGLVSVSDRASAGVYEDKGIPALRDWLARALRNPIDWETRLIADEQAIISATLRELVDDVALRPGADHRRHRPRAARRDARGDARGGDKVMPGFGEQMRQISLAFVPTAILSRQVAVIRGKALDHQPARASRSRSPRRSKGCARPTPPVPGIFAAVPYCIDLIGGPYIETDDAVCTAFRPKSALRKPSGAGAPP